MPIISTNESGYTNPVGHSPEGYPIYLYLDRQTDTYRYVVVLPGNRVVYSDAYGRPLEATPVLPSAIGFGLVGILLGGAVGGLVGALVGGVAASYYFSRRPTQNP